MNDSLTARQWVDASGLTDAEVAEKLGISPSTLSGILSGARGASLALAIRFYRLSGGRIDLVSLVGAKRRGEMSTGLSEAAE